MLAAVVIVAIKGLVKIDEFKRMWRVNRQDFLIAACAFLSVLVFGILDGIIIGAVVSLILIIKVVSTPNVAFLGRIPGTNGFSNIERHPDNEIIPNTLIFRVESPLLYFNVNTVYKTVSNKLAEQKSDLKFDVFDLSASAYIDSSGARLIERLHGELSKRGVVLKLANAHSKVRDTLRKENVESLFGRVGRRDTLLDVVNSIVEKREVYS